VIADTAPGAFALQIGGRAYTIETGRGGPGRRREDADRFVDGEWHLRSPLTGVIVELRVAAGDAVEGGGVLAVVEAMKMLNELRAPMAGRVAAVHTTQGSRVEIGERLLTLTPPAEGASP